MLVQPSFARELVRDCAMELAIRVAAVALEGLAQKLVAESRVTPIMDLSKAALLAPRKSVPIVAQHVPVDALVVALVAALVAVGVSAKIPVTQLVPDAPALALDFAIAHAVLIVRVIAPTFALDNVQRVVIISVLVVELVVKALVAMAVALLVPDAPALVTVDVQDVPIIVQALVRIAVMVIAMVVTSPAEADVAPLVLVVVIIVMVLALAVVIIAQTHVMAQFLGVLIALALARPLAQDVISLVLLDAVEIVLALQVRYKSNDKIYIDFIKIF